MRLLLVITISGLITATAFAADTPIVEVEITPQQVTVGESIQLRVTVLGPSWFPVPPEYPSFEIPNAVVRLPSDSSRPFRKQVGNESWSGIARNYEVIPLIGARFQLVDQSIEITYANVEDVANPLKVTVEVPPVEFTAVVPQGAENLKPYIGGREFSLSREVEGDATALASGDALVMVYTGELDGLPSMFIPDIVSAVEIPGVSIYADRPTFSDDGIAQRTEKLTFVFEAGGEFELPGVSLDWWNSETSSIETASVAPLTVSVVGPPLAVAVEASETVEPNRLKIAALILLGFIALIVLRRLTITLSARRKHREQERLESEPYAYEQLSVAIRSKDPHLTYERILSWLDRLDGTRDLRGFAAKYGVPELQEQFAGLSSSLYSGKAADLDFRALAGALDAARGRFQAAARQVAHTMLPNLNP